MNLHRELLDHHKSTLSSQDNQVMVTKELHKAQQTLSLVNQSWHLGDKFFHYALYT